jgi:hypothetical protein
MRMQPTPDFQLYSVCEHRGSRKAGAFARRQDRASRRPGGRHHYGARRRPRLSSRHQAKELTMTIDDKTRTELEAAVFRRLVEHLRTRTDVQNIDLMNLAGFCRNCLSNWMKDAADAKGLGLSKDESREAVYGMPYDEWRAKYQKEAGKEQQATFEKAAAHKH